jgi:hypothetical protein
MSNRRPFVHEAELVLGEAADTRAPGGAVTVALCGHWDHEGPRRWPHTNAIVVEHGHARLRTVFVAPPGDEDVVRERIDRGLRAADEWTVVDARARPLTPEEKALARRLLFA